MATTPMVKVIYGKPMLPDLARVLACLYEKKITFELEDMNKGVRMSHDILNLQISSHGRTPVLLDGSEQYYGSRKICRYIVENYGVYGYQHLLGKDPLARVSVEQWIQSEEQRFDPPSSSLVFYLAYKIEADVEKATQSEKKLEKVLNLYDQRLGESDFLAGNYFTLADLYHLPNTYYLESSVEYGYLFKDRKNVSRWWKKISQRDSWKQVIRKFEEEGLQFNVPVSKSERDQSSSSPRKNGIQYGAIGGSEIGSRKQEAKTVVGENKGDTNASANKKESMPGKENKNNEAVQGKTEGQKDETTLSEKEKGLPSNYKKTDQSEGGKKPEATDQNKETSKLNDKGKSGKTDEIKEPNKPVIKDEKETPKSHDNDKSSTGEKEKSVKTGNIIEQDVDEPAVDFKKEEPKQADQDKSSPGDKSKLGVNDGKETSDAKKSAIEDKKSVGQEQPGKTDEIKGDADKPGIEGKKETHKADDEHITSPGDKEKPANIDGIKERDANKKDAEGEKDAHKSDSKDKDPSGKAEGKIEENKEHKTNNSDTKGMKDEFKSDEKHKDSSGNEKERDVNKENENHRGSIDSDNQVKKGSASNDGGDKTSQGENKNPTPKDGKEKTN